MVGRRIGSVVPRHRPLLHCWRGGTPTGNGGGGRVGGRPACRPRPQGVHGGASKTERWSWLSCCWFGALHLLMTSIAPMEEGQRRRFTQLAVFDEI